jgi:hypothetical protein
VLAHLIVFHGEKSAQLDFAPVIVERRAIECAEDELLIVIAVIDANPHPFANARHLIRELYLYVIALLIFRHVEASKRFYLAVHGPP